MNKTITVTPPPSVLQLKEKRVYDVKEIVRNITEGARSELEKLRAIWVWLCHSIGGWATPANACFFFLNPPPQNKLVFVLFFLKSMTFKATWARPRG